MKILRNLIIVALILGVVFIGIGFAAGATVENIFDGMSGDNNYILQDPIIFEDSMVSLNIDVETRNVIIESTTESDITITYYEREEETWSIDLTDNILTISQSSDNINWLDWVWPWSDVLDLVIEIPDSYVFDIDTYSETGSIELSDFDELDNVSLTANTGSIDINNITVYQIEANANTGSVDANAIQSETLLSLISGTGSVDVDEATATTMVLNANTGSVNATHITADTLNSIVNTGSIDLDYVTIDQLDLSANTGSIDITHIDLTNRSLDLGANTGSIRVNGTSHGSSYQLVLSNTYYINAETNTGSIHIDD